MVSFSKKVVCNLGNYESLALEVSEASSFEECDRMLDTKQIRYTTSNRQDIQGDAGMKLTVKQIVKKIKKVYGLETTVYSCSLEGMELRKNSGVWGKLTLESENPESLKAVVAQVIDAEVDILFTNSQRKLEDYELKLEREFANQVRSTVLKTISPKNQTIAEDIVDTFGVDGARSRND